MFLADELPCVPYWRVLSDAYIVNTDPAGQPGEHWLAIWTRNRVCVVFDSFGLPKKGGARFRRKPRLVDKIAEGIAMGLSGPAPNFAKMGISLAKQAFKGKKDNVHHYQRGKGLGTVLSTAAKIGYKLGKDKRYRRMGTVGATGHYTHFRKPWET